MGQLGDRRVRNEDHGPTSVNGIDRSFWKVIHRVHRNAVVPYLEMHLRMTIRTQAHRGNHLSLSDTFALHDPYLPVVAVRAEKHIVVA